MTGWRQQRDTVTRLATLADTRRDEARRKRDDLKLAAGQTIGRIDTLAWLFAAGALWSASQRDEKSRLWSTAARAANASLLAWQLAK